jgi:hypothetical protein
LERPRERKGGARGDQEEVEPDTGERGAAAEAAAGLEVAAGPWWNAGEGGGVMGGRASGRERSGAISLMILASTVARCIWSCRNEFP